MEPHLDWVLTELQKIPDQKKTAAKDKASQVDKLMAQIRDKVDEAVKQRATNDEEEMSMIRSQQYLFLGPRGPLVLPLVDPPTRNQ